MSTAGLWQRRQWNPTPVFSPGKSHGQRSLVGCSPWGCYESDMTERLHFHFSLSCIGEGNGNPLQCSCLENPGDRGAWWAAVYGVTQRQTGLKWLSSSSRSLGVNLQPCGTRCWEVSLWPQRLAAFFPVWVLPAQPGSSVASGYTSWVSLFSRAPPRSLC